jgi:hypothetical protein
MKGVKASYFLFLFAVLNTQLFAQDLRTKEEWVPIIVESINQQNVEVLRPFLADDFRISGRVPPISIKILEQLIKQLNEKVERTTWIESKTTTIGEETHYYKFQYSGMGEREVSFTVNADNKIKTLELVKMTVKTLEETAQITKPSAKILEVPFKVNENLMLVEAAINGELKTFIFDSGSPRLILNLVHYGEQAVENERKYSSLEGVHGSINSLDIVTVGEFDFHGIQMKDQKVLAADLSHLETTLETPLAGLVGYEIFKDYDLLYNYSTNTLRLIQPDQTRNFISALGTKLSASVIPFELKQHIPLIEVTISDQTLLLGLDSGASTNLLAKNWFDTLKAKRSKHTQTTLTGADGNDQVVLKADLSSLRIGKASYDSIPTVFKDIDNLKSAYGEKMEGLIGYEILHQQVTLVSYSQEMLFLFTKRTNS